MRVLPLLALTALSALQTPAVRAVDERTLREYAGVYRSEPDGFFGMATFGWPGH